MAAELENTRRRNALDIESVSRNRAMGVAEKILPVMDAVQSALKHNPEDTGIKTMQRALENAFAQIGIVYTDTRFITVMNELAKLEAEYHVQFITYDD